MSTPGVATRRAEKLSTSSQALMVRAYSLDLKERIARSFSQGGTMRSVAESFDVSLNLVHRVVNLYERYGQVTDPDATPCRGRRTITLQTRTLSALL